MSWDEEIYPREQQAADRWPPLQRCIDFHRSKTKKKFFVEHGIGISLGVVLFFFFGFKGLVVAIALFITRELVMACFIEVVVNVVLKKTGLPR